MNGLGPSGAMKKMVSKFSINASVPLARGGQEWGRPDPARLFGRKRYRSRLQLLGCDEELRVVWNEDTSSNISPIPQVYSGREE